MPSLNELNEFKNSFWNIANQRDDSRARDLPFDTLPLPDTEAVPLEEPSQPPAAVEPEQADFDITSFLDTMGDSPPAEAAGSQPSLEPQPSPKGEGSFLDDFLNDLTPPPETTPLAAESLSSLDDFLSDIAPPAAADLSSFDDFLSDIAPSPAADLSSFDNFLSDIAPPAADDTPSAAEVPVFEEPEPLPAEEISAKTQLPESDEIPSLDDFDLPASDDASGDSLPSLDDFELPVSEDTESDSLPSFDDFDLPVSEDNGLSDELPTLDDFDLPASDDVSGDELPPLEDLGVILPSEDDGLGDELLPLDDLEDLLPPESEDTDDSLASFNDFDLPSSDDVLGETDELPSLDDLEDLLPPDDDSDELPPLDDFELPASDDVLGDELPPLDDFDLPASDDGLGEADELPPLEDLGDLLPPSESDDTSGSLASFGDFDLPASDDGLGDELPPLDDFDLPASDDGVSDSLPPLDDDDFAIYTKEDDTLPPLEDDFELPASDDGTSDELPPLEDDFAVPEDLLSGFADEIESTPSDFETDSVSSEELPDFDIDIPDPSDNLMDLGGEKQDGDFTTDSIPVDDFILPEDDQEDPFASGEDDGAPLPADFGTDDFSQDAGSPDMELPDFDLGDSPQESTQDSADDFSIDDVSADTSADISADFSTDTADTAGFDDFILPGLDDMLDKTKIKIPETAAPKGKKSKKDDEEISDPDEIKLSQEDLERLQKTLSRYPLNLRIACEELIAEQVLAPQDLSKLLRSLINGMPPKEMARMAGKLLGRTIFIPKSFEKSTGADLEEEKGSFAYIFVHNFLPVLRLFAIIAALAASIVYLGYQFIYTPLRAESIYRRGYEQIYAGQYQRANELFNEAFALHRKKNWFYRYAEGFRTQRRFMLAEDKYEELLFHYPRDKKGVLDYADLQTNYILNYEKASRILNEHLLDFTPNDYDGLLAAGDNFFAWADSDPERFFDRYEDARFSWARILDLYGWTGPIMERMMKYFIRIDDLREVLYVRNWFDNSRRDRLSTESMAELGGYLLDKQLEDVRGVPNPYIESIESVRDMLLQAVRENVNLPEPHYHLARYYESLGNTYDERLTLENAIEAFRLAPDRPVNEGGGESVRRRLFRVDAHYRYANLLTNNREFFPAEEHLVRAINLFNEFRDRNLITSSPQLGRLYAAKGDLEYFVKTSNMRAALEDYHNAEQHGWSPPEIQYRMGAAYYQLGEENPDNWGRALEYIFRASAELPLNRKLLYALGNTAYQRGDYFAAQGYYNRLIDMLENQRVRLPVTLPNDRPEFLELGERLMMARNNAGVVYEALADQTGNHEYRARALALYASSAHAWDSITRNPESMRRMSLTDTPGAPGINLGFLNAANATRPSPEFSPQIFPRIDKDVLEPSRWEELAPFGGLIH